MRSLRFVRIFSLISFWCGLFGVMILSGCSTEPFTDSSKITVMAEGHVSVDTEDLFLPDVFLNDENGDPLFMLEGDLQNITDPFSSHVIVKGQVSSFQEEIPRLEVFDSFVFGSGWKNMVLNTPQTLIPKIEISVPNVFQLEEKEGFYRIAKEGNTTFAFVLFEVKDKKKQKFFTEAEQIFLGKKGEDTKEKKWYRQFQNNTLSFYSTEFDIQVDFKGENTDLHLFYSILESFRGIDNRLENQDKKEAQESTEQEGGGENEASIQKKQDAVKLNAGVIDGVRSFMETLAGEKKVSRVEIWEDFLLIEEYAPSIEKDQKKQLPEIVRTLFRVQEGKEEVSLQKLKQWTWKEDEWKSDEKGDTVLKSSNRFFPSHLLEEYVFLRPKGFVHYLSSRYYFSVSYPHEMYYNETEEDGALQIFFGNSPHIAQVEGVDFPENTVFVLSILPGGVDTRQENIEEGSILIPKSENAHFQFLTSDPEFFGIMQDIANTLVVYADEKE